VRRGYEFNAHLRAVAVSSHTGAWGAEHSFVGVEQDNVVLTAVKKTEDGDALLFRFYEWAGKNADVQLSVPVGATSATLTNLMEQAEGAPLTISRAGKISVAVHPYQIVSVRVEYPRGGVRAEAAQ
jgi:alpha-mannosidase